MASSLEQLFAAYSELEDQFHLSSDYVELNSRLDRILQVLDEDTIIRQSVCIGLGNLSLEDNTSLCQLVLWLFIVEKLDPSGNITLFAQDPIFTADDEEFLQMFGIHILNNPEAQEHITEETLVFAPFIPWSVLINEFIRDNSSPMFITQNLHRHSEVAIQQYSARNGRFPNAFGGSRQEITDSLDAVELFLEDMMSMELTVSDEEVGTAGAGLVMYSSLWERPTFN